MSEDDHVVEATIMREVIEVLTEKTKGSKWSPPEGGIIVDSLCVLVYAHPDGTFGSCWLSAGSVEQAEGMARKVIRSINRSDFAFAIATIEDDDT